MTDGVLALEDTMRAIDSIAHQAQLPTHAGRPVILIASTTWWAFPARIAMACAARGLAVEVICGRGHPLLKTSAVSRNHPYGALRPLNALARAITRSKAAMVLPCDDRALAHLHSLHETTPDETLRATIARSLGEPASFQILSDRCALIAHARQLGIAAPETLPIAGPGALDTALHQLGLPAVLKLDGTWGGFGVAILRNKLQAKGAFTRLSRRISLAQVIKRLLVDRDPFHIRPWVQRQKTSVSLQAYVHGHPGNSVSACLNGEILGTICAESVSVQRPLGASTVVRIIDHPQMAQAAERLARSLNLSGVFGLDFLIDEATGAAQLVEMNARATPLCHLGQGEGQDLIGAIAHIAGLTTISPPPRSIASDVIAYFPQAWHACPQDPWLRCGFHDVPWEDPVLLQELLRKPWPDRGILAGLRRWFAERKAAQHTHTTASASMVPTQMTDLT